MTPTITPTISYVLSGLIWLAVAALVVSYEWWALATGHPTLSAWVWHMESRLDWFRWVIFGGLVVLIYHFVFQRL